MQNYELSPHGKSLIELYKIMVSEGYQKVDGSKTTETYNDFQLKKFRKLILPKLSQINIQTVLDYGGGGSCWEAKCFDTETGCSAIEYFGLAEASVYEPARGMIQKTPADAVVCIDVLEHIFVADIPNIVEELFKLSKELLVINVACYEAAALLPNGENAHVTIRSPDYWKGIIDAVAIKYPSVEVLLICSETYDSGVIFESFKASEWHASKTYRIDPRVAGFTVKYQSPKTQ